MTEFKIGDKVVVLADSESSYYEHVFCVGDIGIVLFVDDNPGTLGVFVEINGLTQWLHPSELELVNE